MLTLDEIGVILGCSKAAASMLRNGTYERRQSDLVERYRVLVQAAGRVDQAAVLQQVCCACPREDCTGCRVAEIHD